ncbi:bifunctional ornithine acetyltransferase/N-acetylglutamate synthase [Candidatus Epulonipiscium viviparus]|uniref:bifunctional ornithine acetyltransferase/N-acetylglutamate synthase n=1 Tax=Candidatus Epulonipiscium viviparus TaxID=420336 RepID=UPI002738166A|nr:bifunctional ornithine acetyltransferase/N-acetylglutamate synthase [Candidatus Epulopiscium viviparus]
MFIEGGITAPIGFQAGAVHCGIRKNATKNDLAVIISDVAGPAAAVYTTNKVFGAPITVTREHLTTGKAQLFICNSGNANTCNKDGVELANKMSQLVADKFNIAEDDVIIASTGVIGQSLPIDKIAAGISKIAVCAHGSVDAAEAIMTTDLVIKEVAVEFEIAGTTCKIGAIAKGSGMIAPNMATMLSFITTDTDISAEMLQLALAETVAPTYNMVDVDGDTSTNDMVSIIANGLAGNAPITEDSADFRVFVDALMEVNLFLAKKIAKDGEGASKLLIVEITNAADDAAAKKLAKAVTASSLVKTAVYGNDANWGRILCALGYADVDFDPENISVKFKSKNGEILICTEGASVMFDESVATHVLNESEITIWVDMHQGAGSATAFGCDLTEKYVDINASYRS